MQSRLNLIHAAKNNNIAQVIKVLRDGTEINYLDTDKDNNTHCALTNAVQIKAYAIVKLLISENADVNICITKNSNQYRQLVQTPLWIAIENCDLYMVEILINSGAKLNTENQQAIDLLRVVIKSWPTQDAIKLIFFLFNKNINLLNIFSLYNLEQLFVYLNFNERNEFDHTKIQLFKAFLKADWIKTTEINDRFLYASSFMSLSPILIMQQEGFQFSKESISEVLCIACESKFPKADLITWCLNQGADIELAKKQFIQSGCTELMFYVGIGDIAKVQQLLLQKVDVNAKSTSHHQSALDLAIKLNRVEIFKVLITHPDININNFNRIGNTPLMLAAQLGRVEIIAILLNKNADVNKQTDKYFSTKGGKETALMFAIKERQTPVITQLLNHAETNIHLKNANHLSALDLVKQSTPEIKKIVAIRLSQKAISQCKIRIEKMIGEYKANAKEIFSIGNNKKAIILQNALDRALQCEDALTSVDNFLNYKINKEPAILDVLSAFNKNTYRRMLADFLKQNEDNDSKCVYDFGLQNN